MADPKQTADRRTEAAFNDRTVPLGAGGETHQTATGDAPIMTTDQGVPVSDDQNSLRAGARGPALLEDFVSRTKLFHFDDPERIPERVVHARGVGAHGYFETYESLADITCADLLQRAGERTPAFVRFSTVAGGKGSPDLARDVRGFAVKLYTREGNWDIVGNNIPVFFHPGCHQVPRPDPRRQGRAGSRVPPGPDRARQLLALARHAPARDFVADAYAHLEYIGHTDEARVLLDRAGVPADDEDGVICLAGPKDAARFVEAARNLRLWRREARVNQF